MIEVFTGGRFNFSFQKSHQTSKVNFERQRYLNEKFLVFLESLLSSFHTNNVSRSYALFASVKYRI